MLSSSKRQIIYTTDTLSTSCASSPRLASPSTPTSPNTSPTPKPARYRGGTLITTSENSFPHSSPYIDHAISVQSSAEKKSDANTFLPPVAAAQPDQACQPSSPRLYLPIITSLQEDLAAALADLAASEARENHWRQRAQRAEVVVKGLEAAVSTWQTRYQELLRHPSTHAQRGQMEAAGDIKTGDITQQECTTEAAPKYEESVPERVNPKQEPDFDSDVDTLNEEVLERKMMDLNVEKSSLERELAKFPYGTAGRTVGQRRRKMDIENRLQDLDKELNTVRKGLRHLGCI